MNPRRYLSLIFPFVALLVLSACGRSDSASSDCDSEGYEEDTLVMDSVVEKASGLPSEPTVRRFASAEEAVEYMKGSPHRERYMAGILPRMAEDNLEYCRKLLNNTHDGFIVVDKDRMKVILFDKYGVERRSYGMACAKNYGTKHKKADSRTPEGFFDVEGIYDSTDWLFTDDNGVQSPKKGQFGPRFIRLRTPVSSQIGIHGTCAPWSIGGRSSHGCIRIKNENILELVELVEKGMPVIVTPGKKDMAVNAREGYAVASISTIPGRRALVAPEVAPESEKTHADTSSSSTHTPDTLLTQPTVQDAVPSSSPVHAPDDDQADGNPDKQFSE